LEDFKKSNNAIIPNLMFFLFNFVMKKIGKGAWNSLENIQVPSTRFLAKIAITCKFFELVFILLVNFCKKVT
jgi:hypothetical protein